jgi:hypothetical protein
MQGLDLVLGLPFVSWRLDTRISQVRSSQGLLRHRIDVMKAIYGRNHYLQGVVHTNADERSSNNQMAESEAKHRDQRHPNIMKIKILFPPRVAPRPTSRDATVYAEL